jgi:uncharacterized protein (DUF1684 family)
LLMLDQPLPANAPVTIPAPYALADWRRRINDLYAQIRTAPTPRAGWDHWVATRSEMFRNHPMSPIAEPDRAAFIRIDTFDYDPDFRFAVDLKQSDGPIQSFDLGWDGLMRARPIAKTSGLADRLNHELTVFWIEGYGGGLFIPFTDATSGTSTYGGGRYLADAIKGSDLGLDADGRLILDFNFAYNPSCALNPDFVCPLSPPENRLPVAIEAGERI